MSWTEGEIETDYVMETGRDNDCIRHGEGEIKTSYAMDRGRYRDRLCQEERER